jgi:hypothetical protein
MRIGLSQSALNRLMQEMRLVVARYDQGDQTGLRCSGLFGDSLAEIAILFVELITIVRASRR